MSNLLFRYSATGNTFLIGDNREGQFGKPSKEEIEKLCSAGKVDGLIFLEKSENEEADFHMRYYNNDGGEVEMCGNGARSIVHFAKEVAGLEETDSKFKFSTKNSLYEGRPQKNYPIKMNEIGDWEKYDVSDLYEANASYFLNTGVPHCIYLVDDVSKVPLDEAGNKIRFHERFPGGTNINWVQILDNQKIRMRTFERGVDGETDSCGTGATAAALAMSKIKNWNSPISVVVNGGELTISFSENYSEVFLEGPVDFLGEHPSDQ